MEGRKAEPPDLREWKKTKGLVELGTLVGVGRDMPCNGPIRFVSMDANGYVIDAAALQRRVTDFGSANGCGCWARLLAVR